MLICCDSIFSWSDGPSHVSISGEKNGLAGQTIQLLCVLDSHPPPSITWYRLKDSSQVSFQPAAYPKSAWEYLVSFVILYTHF